MTSASLIVSHFYLRIFHISGRTARAGAKGVTIAFVSQSDSTAFAATLKTVSEYEGMCVYMCADK